eukprot:CAMPEP_0196572444 /NCGR_PEP_ID=MMETSP1081-20130531/2498_1 /TAXON_ID=36882 /ORGANISM="Pyramimonas amylifera, Strain CCMP720" /LENGTH=89 /DNA_ID=CAMNT_0041889775 /DNA_START=454 /DNA_END=720 /DNA_ORIENTATION=+
MPTVELTLGQALRGGGNSAGSFSEEMEVVEIKPVTSGKLRDVVGNGTQRWFQETLELAQAGEYRQMALLGEMLAEGYGCAVDHEAAKMW